MRRSSVQTEAKRGDTMKYQKMCILEMGKSFGSEDEDSDLAYIIKQGPTRDIKHQLRHVHPHVLSSPINNVSFLSIFASENPFTGRIFASS